MKKLLKNLILLGVLLFMSCTKDESVIDKSILMNYTFQHSLIYVEDGGTIIKKDTILYSFIDEKTVSATKYHYELSHTSIYELTNQETYSRKYVVDDNSIYFIFNSSNIETYDYLFSFKWDVKLMNKDVLSVDLYTNNQYKGCARLKCIKK